MYIKYLFIYIYTSNYQKIEYTKDVVFFSFYLLGGLAQFHILSVLG